MWIGGKGIKRWSLVLIASALTLAACAGQPAPHTVVPRGGATATLAPQPKPAQGLLDPLPTNCHQSAPPDTRQFGPLGGFRSQMSVEGAGPAWLTSGLYDLSLEPDGAYQALPATKMLWALGPNNTQPVTISGQNMVSGAPLWIEVYGVTPPATTVTLPPGQNNRGSGKSPDGSQWEIWGTGLIFTQAGCYQMTVAWPGGQWQTVFAVGR